MSDTPSHEESVRKVADLMEGVGIAMFANQNHEGKLVSRPMALQQVGFVGDLWFFTYEDSEKVRELQARPQCNVAFSGKNSWVSLSGSAEIINDKAKAQELWQPILKAWFPQETETPGLRLIKVHADSAEYWDTSSNKLVQLFGMAKAAATGKPAQGGENHVVNL